MNAKERERREKIRVKNAEYKVRNMNRLSDEEYAKREQARLRKKELKKLERAGEWVIIEPKVEPKPVETVLDLSIVDSIKDTPDRWVKQKIDWTEDSD